MLYKIENLLKEIKEKLVQNSEILTNVKKKECEKFKECLSKQFDQICFDKLKIFELKSNKNSIVCKVEKKKSKDEIKDRIRDLLGESKAESKSNIVKVIEMPSKMPSANANFKIELAANKNCNGKFPKQLIYEGVGKQNKNKVNDKLFCTPYIPKYFRHCANIMQVLASDIREKGSKMFNENVYTKISVNYKESSINLCVKGENENKFIPILSSKYVDIIYIAQKDGHTFEEFYLEALDKAKKMDYMAFVDRMEIKKSK